MGRSVNSTMKWWPGDYNNDNQIARLRSAGKPVWLEDDTGKGGHIEVESHYRKVNVPAIEEHGKKLKLKLSLLK